METTVKLSCKVLDVKDREFSISHAQSLLDKEKEMGVDNWKLTDTNFKLNNGIIQRSNNKADKGTESEKSATESR